MDILGWKRETYGNNYISKHGTYPNTMFRTSGSNNLVREDKNRI
jgi:hypothetical protein